MIIIICAIQAVMLGGYVAYKRRRKSMPKKYL
jgi:hypothetical protein